MLRRMDEWFCLFEGWYLLFWEDYDLGFLDLMVDFLCLFEILVRSCLIVLV